MILAIFLLLLFGVLIAVMLILIFGAADSIGWTRAGRARDQHVQQMKAIASDIQKTVHHMDHPDEEYFEAEKGARGDGGG
jgi:hypothetical protein